MKKDASVAQTLSVWLLILFSIVGTETRAAQVLKVTKKNINRVIRKLNHNRLSPRVEIRIIRKDFPIIKKKAKRIKIENLRKLIKLHEDRVSREELARLATMAGDFETVAQAYQQDLIRSKIYLEALLDLKKGQVLQTIVDMTKLTLGFCATDREKAFLHLGLLLVSAGAPYRYVDHPSSSSQNKKAQGETALIRRSLRDEPINALVELISSEEFKPCFDENKVVTMLQTIGNQQALPYLMPILLKQLENLEDSTPFEASFHAILELGANPILVLQVFKAATEVVKRHFPDGFRGMSTNAEQSRAKAMYRKILEGVSNYFLSNKTDRQAVRHVFSMVEDTGDLNDYYTTLLLAYELGGGDPAGLGDILVDKPCVMSSLLRNRPSYRRNQERAWTFPSLAKSDKLTNHLLELLKIDKYPQCQRIISQRLAVGNVLYLLAYFQCEEAISVFAQLAKSKERIGFEAIRALSFLNSQEAQRVIEHAARTNRKWSRIAKMMNEEWHERFDD